MNFGNVGMNDKRARIQEKGSEANDLSDLEEDYIDFQDEERNLKDQTPEPVN